MFPWRGRHGRLLSALWNWIAVERAFLLQLRHGCFGGATHGWPAAGPSACGPPNRWSLSGLGAGQRLGCGSGPHFSSGRVLLLRGIGCRGLPSRMDRHPRRAVPRTGSVSSKCMNGAFEVDSTRLSFQDIGAGMPLVLLHPTPLDHDYWRPLVEDLAGVRAIVPGFRGHGGSQLGDRLPVGGFERVPDAPVLSMKQLAADVLSLLDYLEVTEAVFVGCS